MQDSHPLYAARNRHRLKQLGIMLALLTLAGELFVHLHGYFSFAEIFGFYGLGGLVATVILIVAALLLRAVLQRPEGYYDDH